MWSELMLLVLTLTVFKTRDHLSLISGVTLTGCLATLTRARPLTGPDSIGFLQYLYLYWGADC
jgi:hypothetical protein